MSTLTLGSHPTITEVLDYYLRPEILAELFRATQIRDVTFIYREKGLWGERPIDLRPEDAGELGSFLWQFFEERQGRLQPYPWFAIGDEGRGSRATAYSTNPRRLIGWDAIIEFDFGWRKSFGMLYNGMQVLDDFGIFYRLKFSGHRSLHCILPAEATPERLQERPNSEVWCTALSRVGAFVTSRSDLMRHGWPIPDHEPTYSGPYSVHREWGLAAVPLTRSDCSMFRPWMANLHLVSPVDGWWNVPDDAGANLERLLQRIACGRRYVDLAASVGNESATESGYVPQAVETARKVSAGMEPLDRLSEAWQMMNGFGGVDRLLQLAGDGDAMVRWFALESLGELAARGRIEAGTIEAAEEVEQALRDNDPYVEQAALDLLCRLGTPGRERLLRLIRSEEAAFWTLCDWVGRNGEKAIEKLMTLIVGRDKELSAAALLVIGKLARRAAPWLADLLSSGEERTRLKALCSLLELGDGAVPYLRAVEEEGNEPAKALVKAAIAGLENVRLESSQAQGRTRFQRITCLDEDLELAMLREQTASADRQKQFLAFQELIRIGDRALPTLIECLRNGDPIQRRRACESLRDMAPEKARDALRDALSDQDPKVRQNAVRALIRISRQADPEALSEMRSDASRAVRRIVREAMGADT